MEETINVEDILEYLLNEYEFDYYFSRDELKTLGFKYPDFKWVKKPIVVASGKKSSNTFEIMAFGGCIGILNLKKRKADVFSQDSKKRVLEFAKYLYPSEGSNDDFYINGYGQKIILPRKFQEKYKSPSVRINRIIEYLDGYVRDALISKEYLDLVVCAAYVRFMHRHKKVMEDFSERSIQTMIARYSLDHAREHDLLVVDIEYKKQVKGKTPSVDFVLLDMANNSLGLVEFKYQGLSMAQGSRNDLSVHFTDFYSLIHERKKEVICELIEYIEKLIEYKVVQGEKVCSSLGRIKESYSEGKCDELLWCGFYFIDEKKAMTQRDGSSDSTKEKRNHIIMTMDERIVYDCKQQIVNKYKSVIEDGSFVPRYQHSDISDTWEIRMDKTMKDFL